VELIDGIMSATLINLVYSFSNVNQE